MRVINDECPNCHARQTSLSSHCDSCQEFLGFPNVRLSDATEEVSALNDRIVNVENEAEKQNLKPELESFERYVDEMSNVVVAVSVEIALQLVTDPSFLYAGYEQLVSSGVRTPASFANDAHRHVVSGALFGSSAEQIRYGVLSLSNRGLRTYGEIFCKLKRVAVEKRTSFLEENSYDYYRKYGEIGKDGSRASWGNRSKLAAVKLWENGSIKKHSTEVDWEKSMLICDGKNRNLDDFIEAHIFGSFNVHSIEELIAATPIDRGREIFVQAVIDGFKSR